jgi:hypothetical protein
MTMAPMTVRAALALAALTLSATAMAQTDPRVTAARRALIEDAQRARQAGDHRQALTLAQRAIEMQPSPTLRRFVAEELLANRRFAESAGMAELCEGDFRQTAPSRARNEHIAACQAVRAEASAHTARIVLRFEPALPADGRVTVNDAPLPTALWGVPALVDEGSVVIEVSHPRFQVVQRQVTVGAGTTVDVAVALTPVQTTVAVVERPPAVRQPPPVEPPRRVLSPLRRVEVTSQSPLVATGAVVGGLAAATAVGLYLGATQVAAGFDRACFPNGEAMSGEPCGQRYAQDQSTIDALQWGAVAGLGLTAVGATLAIVGALHPSRRTVMVSTTGRAVVVGGAF